MSLCRGGTATHVAVSHCTINHDGALSATQLHHHGGLRSSVPARAESRREPRAGESREPAEHCNVGGFEQTSELDTESEAPTECFDNGAALMNMDAATRVDPSPATEWRTPPRRLRGTPSLPSTIRRRRQWPHRSANFSLDEEVYVAPDGDIIAKDSDDEMEIPGVAWYHAIARCKPQLRLRRKTNPALVAVFVAEKPIKTLAALATEAADASFKDSDDGMELRLGSCL